MWDFVAIIIVVGIFMFATWSKRENMDELKRALKTIINNGVSVYGKKEKDGYRYHLYQSGNSYTILKFEPNRADLLMDEEESFDCPDDAIAKFLSKIGIKGKK